MTWAGRAGSGSLAPPAPGRTPPPPAGLGQDLPHPVGRERPGDHAQADVVGEADAGGKTGGDTGHRRCSPRASASMAQLHLHVNGIAPNPGLPAPPWAPQGGTTVLALAAST